MQLEQITIVNFKNYNSADFKFSPDINCFTGKNGSGKTSILDAVHYLALCKSYFNAVDSQQIKEGKDFFILQGIFKRLEVQENVSCSVKRNHKKIFRRNKKEYERLSDHIGLFPLVMISPGDIGLVLEGSEERRRFIDNALSQTNRIYLETIIRYNSALANRNALLKAARENELDLQLLDIYSAGLIDTGTYIYEQRKGFFTAFNKLFLHYYALVSSEAELVTVDYISQLLDSDYHDGLMASLPKDRITERTTFGVHKDELEFKLKGNPLKRFGSQGQQKSFLISLKLAHYHYLREKTGLSPILLLDDIFDKLDELRTKNIIQIISRPDFGQTFITDAHRYRLKEILNATAKPFLFFHIEDL